MRFARPLLVIAAACVWLVIAANASAFSEPKQLYSKNGVLRTIFNAQPGAVDIDGKKIHGAYTYNGQYIGPTLNVHPGDRIELTVKNGLKEETNIHFHGLHVSPAGISDNVLRRFLPGRTYKVSVKIPHDHPNGLYWYHPHLHGQVNDQVFRGMAGMISITGGEAEVKALRKFKKRQLGLSVAEYDPSKTTLINPDDQDDMQATTLVNRRSDQTIGTRPGAVELWRIANMSNEVFTKIRLDGHYMWIVGEDGNPTRVAIKAREIVIPPGSRMEVLVRAKKSGSFKLRQLPYFEGFVNFPARTLLTMNVSGKQKPFERIPRHIKAFKDLSHAKVTTRRTWHLGFNSPSAPTFEALINGKQFSPERIDTISKLGGVEEWTFINDTTEQHPLHLHTNDFQVVAVNGKRRKPQAPLDNYIVPASGSLTIRFKPITYTGVAVFHCHILFHEDSGMMATIKFVKNQASTTVIRPVGMASVHDEAVAQERMIDTGIFEPIEPVQHGHHHAPRRAPSSVDPNFWIFCKLNAA
jgi:FtsP/CotA-like multicopper oxidase with cupredoxin domain